MTTIQSFWSHVVTPGYVETAELERGGSVYPHLKLSSFWQDMEIHIDDIWWFLLNRNLY